MIREDNLKLPIEKGGFSLIRSFRGGKSPEASSWAKRRNSFRL